MKTRWMLVVVALVGLLLAVRGLAASHALAMCPDVTVSGDWKIYKAQRRQDGVILYVMWTTNDGYIYWPACQLTSGHLLMIPAELAKDTAWCHDPANQNNDPSDDCRDNQGNPVGPPDNAPRFATCPNATGGSAINCTWNHPYDNPDQGEMALTDSAWDDFEDQDTGVGSGYKFQPGSFRPVMIKRDW